MQKLFAIVSMVGLIALSGPVMGDAAQHMPGCVGCHGEDGRTSMMPDVPIIAGIVAARNNVSGLGRA
jgi:cytochrome c553